MNVIRVVAVSTLLAVSTVGGPIRAQAEDAERAPEAKPDLGELQRQIDVLAEEVEKLRSGEAPQREVSEEQARALGLAPSAASLYRQKSGVSIAGYGEMLYQRPAGENQAGREAGRHAGIDFVRAVFYTGYRFDDRFLFNSEVEVEHADEIHLEFAYLDYLASDALAIRGGMVLIPMGLVNEFHEPNVYLGSSRPETERVIVPSTWREDGIGIHGSHGKLSYRAYVVNGMRASGFSAQGLRGGRQGGGRALAENLAVTARLDLTPTPGVFVGGSIYAGQSGQDEVGDAGVGTTIFEVHGQAQLRGFDLRGLWARAQLDDATALNRVRNLSGTSAVAEAMQGGYLQVGYDVLSQRSGSRVALTPFYRFEKLDTQATMPAGFRRSQETRRTLHTIGIDFKPIHSVVVKLDYLIERNDAETGVNRFQVGLGYAF